MIDVHNQTIRQRQNERNKKLLWEFWKIKLTAADRYD